MNVQQEYDQPIPVCSGSRLGGDYDCLNSDSYTAQRLQHATPSHLHLTSRRFFIGPLPKGWLQAHRKTWYKTWLGLKDYSSRTATFSADSTLAEQRNLTGATGPSPAAKFGPSFPQPDDVGEDNGDGNGHVGGSQHVEHSAVEPSVIRRLSPSQGQERTEGNSNGHMNSSVDATTAEDSRPSQGINHQNHEQPVGSNLKGTTPDRGRLAAANSQNGTNGVPAVRVTQPSDSNNASRLPSPHTSSSMRDATSQTSLLRHTGSAPSKLISREDTRRLREEEYMEGAETERSYESDALRQQLDSQMLSNVASGMVRFNLEDNPLDRELRQQESITQTDEDMAIQRERIFKQHSGEIIRAERMLVRIDTALQSLPDDFNENESTRIDTRTTKTWREFLVVCRQGPDEETPLLLQLYRTRKVPQVQISQVKEDCSHEIPLTSRSTKVNLFSSLDKTIVIWHPYKTGTRIYIMRTRSATHSVEWYTFLHESLGWKPPSTLLVYVPDLNVSLLLKHPFAHLKAGRFLQGEEAEGCSALLRTMAEEKAIASGIIKTCMSTLAECSEWSDVLDVWMKNEKMGLAWRRYDRLEWVHGANEERMYGTIAMRNSHELELRPKQHYPTNARTKEKTKIEEPEPVEGFLILLTSQRGVHRRWGKTYFRRLYFSVHDQYLCFCKPARAAPPAPPKLPVSPHVPSSAQIAKESPMVFQVDPFPLKNGKIAWLSSQARSTADQRDAEAYAESRRNIANLEHSEGYFDLRRVAEVRAVSQDCCRDESGAHGGDSEYHDQPQGRRRSSTTFHQEQRDRSFELVLIDGLIVKLRAYNTETRDLWVQRLSELARYWKARSQGDITAMKHIRQQNLNRLEIDEALESLVGQFAQKWEVSRAQASPELFNICGISGCRPVRMSGALFRRPYRRANFARCSVILTEGQLLIFQSSLRTWSGEEMTHTHHERQTVMNLRDCYVYSGLITSSDMLYQNRTFDANAPTQRPSPRVYLNENWTSSDDDAARCFVIWVSTKKTLFRQTEDVGDGSWRVETHWRQVAALGVPGLSVVFKARSRSERDLWVLAIETEIDRMQQREDVKIVRKGH